MRDSSFEMGCVQRAAGNFYTAVCTPDRCSACAPESAGCGRLHEFVCSAFSIPRCLLAFGSPARRLRHLAAGLARFGKADRNRLLATLDLLARLPAAKFAVFHLMHRALDLFRSFLAVSGHPCVLRW